MSRHTVLFRFESRREARRAAAAVALAVSEIDLQVKAFALVRWGYRGRLRTTRSLPPTRDQLAEHRLHAMASLTGLTVDADADAFGLRHLDVVPDDVVHAAAAGLAYGEAAVVLVLGEPCPTVLLEAVGVGRPSAW